MNLSIWSSELFAQRIPCNFVYDFMNFWIDKSDELVYNVCVNYNTSEKEAKELCEELAKDGCSVIIYQADITKRDEVDKMVKDYKGDPASTLLEILDPVQNKYFIDNYIEEPFDLSKVLFILTANYINDIPITLLDRVEIIELNSYTLFEKKDIAKKYLLPNIFAEHIIIDESIRFSDELLYIIINNYTKEAGDRE